MVLVGLKHGHYKDMEYVPLSLERQFNRLQSPQETVDKNLEEVTGGMLEIVVWNFYGKDCIFNLCRNGHSAPNSGFPVGWFQATRAGTAGYICTSQ